MRRSFLLLGALAPVLAVGLMGCPDPEEQPPSPRIDGGGGVDAPIDVQPTANKSWHTVASNLPEAVLSVSGTSNSDVWVVGADKGAGPRVNHYDGSAWSTLATGQRGDLWWVHALPNKGPVFMAGASAMLLRYDGTKVQRLQTPGLAKQTIFGVWAKAANDLYAVGSASGRDGFLWHYDGTRVEQVRLPDNIPRLNGGEVPGLFKVWGEGEDVWVVGAAGTILHRKAGAPFTVVPSNTTDTFFTVHGAAGKVYTVGGASNGRALEINAADEKVRDVSPPATALLQGVFATPTGVVASGERSLVYGFDIASSATFTPFAKGPDLSVQSFHATYVAPEGDVWTVGGDVLTPALSGGGIAHYGEKPVAVLSINAPDAGVDAGPVVTVCPPDVVSAGANKSIARRWNEQILASIRRDIPRPTVHARNLYHLSAAAWDAYAAYDSTADGVFVRERLNAADVDAARREAISYASYRVLAQRYEKAIGGAVSLACYRAVMTELGYDVNDTTDTGNTPRALGNRIGKAVLTFGNTDGSNEANGYADPSPFTSPNPPLVVDSPGITMNDPSVWQPLNLSVSATQNGIVVPAGVQGYIGSAWGGVTPFAMTRASALVPWHDPGPAPVFGAGVLPSVLDVLRKSSWLDPNDGVTIDISPGAYGNNPLGTNSGTGRPLNPATGQPYAPSVVKRGDFGRALAEFWADGPKSETPPGHWDALANTVTDHPSFVRKLFGNGAELSPLAYDVHMYLALNGALHDAAITAWDIKRRTVGARPIAFVRYMSSKGQSSDPTGPSYNASGMPLAAGLTELITVESSKPGQRHEHLSHFIGQIAIKTWRGEPGDHTTELSGVGWVRGVDWMPYQRRSFVTPAFPGFVSGHSTFSRAAAEVLTSITGSAFFPGGFAEFKCPQDKYLVFEIGPTTDVRLQWATYYDAADQAGQSRIWGGIHIEPDDFQGRKVGALIGTEAVTRARTYFDGTAFP